MWNEFKRQVFGSKPKSKSNPEREKLRRDTAKATENNKRKVASIKKQFNLK